MDGGGGGGEIRCIKICCLTLLYMSRVNSDPGMLKKYSYEIYFYKICKLAEMLNCCKSSRALCADTSQNKAVSLTG
jgi:hypothetical protein